MTARKQAPMLSSCLGATNRCAIVGRPSWQADRITLHQYAKRATYPVGRVDLLQSALLGRVGEQGIGGGDRHNDTYGRV